MEITVTASPALRCGSHLPAPGVPSPAAMAEANIKSG